MSDTIEAVAGVAFETVLSPYITGRAATLTIEVFDPSDGAVLNAASGVGIVETATETYRAERAVVTAGDGRIVRWRDTTDGAPGEIVGEDIVDVAAAPLVPGLGEPTYATAEDFEAYVPGWVTDNEAALKAILVRAERDVDLILGLWDLDPVTGLKWTPATELASYEAAALRDATCAQAEYRIALGADFFVTPRPRRVSGPDFTEEWDQAQPHIGPKVWIELARAPRLRKPVGLGRAVI
jgi:hypothetical protein